MLDAWCCMPRQIREFVGDNVTRDISQHLLLGQLRAGGRIVRVQVDPSARWFGPSIRTCPRVSDDAVLPLRPGAPWVTG